MEKLKMNELKHYVSILKWKRAEQRALLELSEKCKEAIVPLIELVIPTVSSYHNVNKKQIRKSPEEISNEMVDKFYNKRMKDIPDELFKCWDTKQFYLDFSLLFNSVNGEKTIQLKIDAINTVIPTCVVMGLHIVPVLNLNDDNKIKRAIFDLQKKHSLAVCLRITTSDLINDNSLSKINGLNKKIDALLRDYSLTRKKINLLIDLKDIKKVENKYHKLINTSQAIDSLSEWKNYIVASGAFPEDLSECKIDDINELPRLDWLNWLDSIKHFKLKRCPIYADYTIRCPIFKDSLQYFSSTTSIKYTKNNDWIVMKGRVREFGLYLVNAKLLVEDSGLFYSKDYSWGDNNITKKAKHYYKWIKDNSIKGTGTAENWIAYGINHHISLVINQIANLS